MNRTVLSATLALTILPACAQSQSSGEVWEWGPRNTDKAPANENQFRAELVSSDVALATETVVEGLVHPWAIEVLPGDAGYLVTERPGRLRHVMADGTLAEPISGVPEVLNNDQGGLLDVALAPDFSESRRIYLSYAKDVGDGLSATAAAHGTLSEDMTSLSDVTEIFVQEPGATVDKHFGSRVLFDGEGHVYITTGEHSAPQYRVFAQDLDKTYGKVIRVTPEGEAPEGNPFLDDSQAVDTIWSYGHRNIQGAMMRDGELWTIEHGPAGGDELNRVQPGLNYGWPVITYGENYNGTEVGSGEAQMEGMEQPVYFWDPVIAPGGMMTYEGDAFSDWQDDVFIGSLAPGGIVRLEMEDGTVTAEERLLLNLGRVRDVAMDADGTILAITDFEDGSLVRIAPGGES